MQITQEVLDYLGSMPQVRQATALLEIPADMRMGEYAWSGTMWGVDFAGADFAMAEGNMQEEGSNLLRLVLGSQIPGGFVRSDGAEMEEQEKRNLEQRLMEEEILVSAQEESMDPGAESTSGGEEQTSAGKPAEHARFSGLLRKTDGVLDQAVLIPLSNALRMRRKQGMEAVPHGLLIEMKHMQDTKTVVEALQKIGIQAENPYEASLEDLDAREQNLRIYFCMSLLLLIFSALYVKNLVWESPVALTGKVKKPEL